MTVSIYDMHVVLVFFSHSFNFNDIVSMQDELTMQYLERKPKMKSIG